MIFKRKQIALIHLPEMSSSEQKERLEKYYEKKLGKDYVVIISFEKGQWKTEIEII